MVMTPAMASGEGTQQVGVDQDFHPNMVFKVDILNVGEVISISAGVNQPDSPKALKVTVRDPLGAHVTGSPFAISKGTKGWLGTPNMLPPATITNARQIVTAKTGTYTVTFNNPNLTWLDPLDITVTSKLSDPVQPAKTIDGRGRLHAIRWTLQGKDFTTKTDADFYVLVPTGGGTDFTWLLEFNGLAGKIYDVIANSKGIPAPFNDLSEIKVNVTNPPLGQFQIYLAPPAEAKGGTVAPVLTGFDFSGCTKHGANSISGKQSQFSFTSNTAATYDIILDTDNDGTFDKTKDTSFTGNAVNGLNTITWNGKDAAGKVVPPGSYTAYISLRLGEFHFVAEDIETVNPGLRIFGVDPPVAATIPKGTPMYWNDTRVNTATLPIWPVTSLPTGINSGIYNSKVVCSKPSNKTNGINAHCWGNFSSNPVGSPGEETFVDTWVYAKESTAKLKVTVLSGTADSDKDGLTNEEECTTYKTDPNNIDTDGDGLNDGLEAKFATNKSDPLNKDSDQDGLTDGEEDKDKDGKVGATETDPNKADTDGDGLKDGIEVKGQNKTDPLNKDSDKDGLWDGAEDKNKNGVWDSTETDPNKWDTDNGGESDGSEVTNKRNPLDPKDDFGGPDLGVPDAGLPDQKIVVPDQMVADQALEPDMTPVADQDVEPDMTPVADQDVEPDMTPAMDMKVDKTDKGVVEKDKGVVKKEDKGVTPSGDGGGLFFYGGGGCSISASDDDSMNGLWLLLPLALVLAAHRRRRWVRRGCDKYIAALALTVVLMAAPAARAQTPPPQVSFNSLIFKPAAATTMNFFQTEGATLLPHLTPSAGVYFTYVHKPLQIWDDGANKTVTDVIKYQVTMDVLVAFGLFDRVEIGVGLPVALTQDSDSLSFLGSGSTVGTGLGDLRIIVKGRLVTLGPVSIGLALPFTVPTGKDEYFLGEDGLTFTPKAVFSLDTKWIDVGLNAGYRLRPNNSFKLASLSNNVILDDELVFSLGAKVALWQEKIDFIADAFMSLGLEEMDKEEIPAEVLGGFRFYLPKGFTAHVGAGPGLTRGVATPVFRAFAGIGYQYKAPPPPPPVIDKDPDKDGILDPNDKCPNEPEDKDGFEDEDGCPDADNDNDGILDVDDKCPLKPEDKDGFEDKDGCPDADNDKDGILDTVDKCPLQPEDKDKFEDEDGCPDPDNDKDGILDKDDKCPVEPESFNGYQDEDGCMDTKPKAKVQITRTAITVPPVYFATNKDRILKRSHPTLLEVVDLLKKNTWVKKIQVEGHTDDRGKDEANLDLSNRRAGSVKQFLLDNGVEASRISSVGYGETKPLVSNKTRKGRAQNRRVDFIILDPVQKKVGTPITAPVEKK